MSRQEGGGGWRGGVAIRPLSHKQRVEEGGAGDMQ